jgi:hypothetical protein
MPAPIVCPHCREELDIPADFYGRRVRCASCQNIFAATPADARPVLDRSPDRGEGERAHRPMQDERPTRRPRPVENDSDTGPPRRSNAGLVVSLLLTVLVVGGCCGGMNLILATQVNPPLTSYSSAEGKFKVEFPAENPTGGPTANPADPNIEGVEASARRDFGQELYRIKCYDLKADWRRLPDREALDRVARAEAEALAAGQEQRREETTHQGFPALDVLAGNGNGITGRDTMMRCIRAGDRVYVVAYQAQKAQPEYWWVRKYFLSFEITDPVAKPPARTE